MGMIFLPPPTMKGKSVPIYTVRIEIPVTYTMTIFAENEDDASDLAEQEFPGLPYLGEQWEESGEADYQVEERDKQ